MRRMTVDQYRAELGKKAPAKPKRRAKAKPESALTNAVLKALQTRRVWAWRVNSGAIKVGDRYIRFAPTGSPDILLVVPLSGRLAGIETKTKSGKLRPSQIAWRDKAARDGVGYAVARSVAEALAALNSWMKETRF